MGPSRRAATVVSVVVALAATAGGARAAPGDLVPSFDGDGKKAVDYGGASDAGSAMVVAPDGKIVAWVSPTARP